MKKIILLEVICLLGNLAPAQNNYWSFQSPYNLSLKRDLIIGGISLTASLVGDLILINENLSSFEIGCFTHEDISKINFIDRGVAGRWDVNAEATGKIFLSASKIGALASIAALPGNLKSRCSLCLIYLEGFLLTQGLTSFVKGTTDRYRPFTYMTLDQVDNLKDDEREQFLENIAGNGIEDSFFSGDASSTSYALTFLAIVFNDYFPYSKLKYGIWGLSITGTILQAYFRARSGNHFPTDVIVGSLVGGSLGFLIPYLHKRTQGQRLSLNPGNNGLSLTFKF